MLFNQAVTATDGLTFTFQGSPVAAGSVAYAGSKATLTVGTMVYGTDYTVAVTDGAAFNATKTFKFELTEPATLTIAQTVYNSQVGTPVELSYVLKDDQGQVMPNQEVFVRQEAYTIAGTSTVEPATSETVVTDVNGVAKVTVNRSEPTTSGQAITAYAVSKPVVRNIAASINWSVAPTGLVTVNDTAAKTLGVGTTRDFTVTLRNTDGTPKTTGLLLADINTAAGTKQTDYALYVRDLSVVDATAANAWVISGGAAGLVHAATTADYVLTLDNTGAGQNVSATGEVQFRVVGLAAKTVVPTFYTNSTNTDAAATINDPSSVAGSTVFVAQTPVITMTAVNAITTVATGAADLGTAAEKAANQFKLYDLSVVDQFGNPYRGIVKVADYRQVDNNGITGPIATSAKFKADTTGNGTYDLVATNLNATVTSLDFAYSSALAGVDKNNSSSMRIAVLDTVAEGSLQLAVWADIATGTGTTVGQIDPSEPKAIGDTLTYAARKLGTANVVAVDSTQTAPLGSLYYTASLYDQFGDKRLANTTLDAAIALKSSGVLQADATKFDVFANNKTAASTTNNWVNMDLAANAAFNLNAITDTNVIPLRIDAKAGADLADWSLIIFESAGVAFNGTQTAGSADFKVVTPALAGATLTNDATVSDNTQVFVADLSGNDGAETKTFTYTLVDQANQKVAAATNNVTFTVVNTGNVAVDVTLEGDSAVALAAGATGTYSKAATAGDLTLAVNPGAGVTDVNAGKIKVDVTATAAGLTGSEKANTLYYYYDKSDAAATEEFLGNVVAFDKTSAAAAKYTTIENVLGYVNISHDLAAFTTKNVKVDGNSTNIAGYESQLTIGDTVKAANATVTLNLELTNH